MGRVILSYGMGVDSTAILLRWLEEPESRGFELSELTVITAQVGDEFESTGRLVREHVLPRLRAAGVRFVQVARAGLSETDGIVVLDDTTEPQELHLRGAYRVSDEMRQAATIPTSGGVRKCSLKFKGWVIDRWLGAELGGVDYQHVIGFNADEGRRVAKDRVYGGAHGRSADYPLMRWGWGREECLAYIRRVTGVEWRKSACAFCPFSRGCSEVLDRYLEEPEGAALAMELEHVALLFNERMLLFKTQGVGALVRGSGNVAALRRLEERLDGQPWAVYRLRRAILPAAKDGRKRGATQRSVERLTSPMGRAEAVAEMGRLAAAQGVQAAGEVAVVVDTGEGFPRLEERLVAAPAYVATKHGRWGREKFEAHWAAVAERLRAAA